MEKQPQLRMTLSQALSDPWIQIRPGSKDEQFSGSIVTNTLNT